MKMKKQVLLWLVPVMLVAGVLPGCDNGGDGSVDQGVAPKPPVKKPPAGTTSEPVNLGVTVSPGVVTLRAGLSQQFTAELTGGGDGTETFTWTVEGGDAGDTAIDGDGILTLGAGETAEALTVKAALASDSGKYGTAILYIAGNGGVPEEHGIRVSPNIITLGKGVEQTFTAVFSASGASVDSPEWSVSGDASSITEAGVLTAGENEEAEKLIVRAEVDGKYGTAIVYIAGNGGVLPVGGPFPENLGVAVSPQLVTLNKGGLEPFTQTGALNTEWVLSGDSASMLSDKTPLGSTLNVGQTESASKIAVKARDGYDPAKYGTGVVTVRGNEAEPAVVNDGLTVWPQYVGVERGAGKTFTARDGNGNEVTSGITWRVLGGGASGTSITSGGALSVALEETAKYLVVRAETSDGSNGTAVVTVAPLITLTLNSVTADGAANTVTTTELTLNFSSPGISGLVASDITLNPGLTKGTLTESGTQYKLGVSGISAETSVTVTVSKSGYSISGNGKAVTVYWWDPVNSPYAPNMVQVTGGSMTLNGTNVMLSSFWISNHEVTQKEWTKVMGAAPGSSWSSSYGVGDNYPVYYINWYDAVEFCNALSEKEGLTKAYTINKSVKDSNNTSGSDSQKWLVTVVTGANGYRLPTDAEWEYAARGGQNSQGYTYSGSDTAGDVAWYTDNSGSKTHPVGGKVANELGLYDMSGNVWEWCWDWYDSSSYPSSNNNPTGASSGSSRLHRGGSWYDSASIVPSANRGGYNPSNRVGNVGFRVARSATP